MLRRLGKHYGVPLRGVPVIGDSERDLAAARAVDARPILVLTGNGRKTKGALDTQGQAVECYEDLLAAAKALASESH
jgi:D-glycero-D-manno-heptose 1,7-bisphosphate phosphatase